MKRDAVERIARAVLYEGYMLYPYRRSALKNQRRWNFGIVYPNGIEPNRMITECLVEGGADAMVEADIRFLHTNGADSDEASEHQIHIPLDVRGTVNRRDFRIGLIQVALETASMEILPGLSRVQVRIINDTPSNPGVEPLSLSLISAHTILTIQNGRFISLLEPPERFAEAAEGCVNVGTFPVLVGRAPDCDCMLSSPIILYDYPQVAPESPGDFFDGAEIDEMLSLRVLTLTDDEKEEVRQSGEHARKILERTEALTPDQLLKLHGIMRDSAGNLKRGDRVRLKPKPGADSFDVLLAGRVAIVESIERDFEDRVHVAVVIEDDPGKDLGFMRQPGHRFFFALDEMERLP